MSIWSPCLSLPRAGNTNLHHVTCTHGTHFQMNKNCAGGSMQMPPSPAVMYYFLLWERQDVTHWSPVLSLAVIWISISNSLVLQDIKYLYIQGDYPKLVAHVCHIAKVHEDTDICDFKRIILVFFFFKIVYESFFLLSCYFDTSSRQGLGLGSQSKAYSIAGASDHQCQSLWKNFPFASGHLMTEPKGNGISRSCAVETGLSVSFSGGSGCSALWVHGNCSV